MNFEPTSFEASFTGPLTQNFQWIRREGQLVDEHVCWLVPFPPFPPELGTWSALSENFRNFEEYGLRMQPPYISRTRPQHRNIQLWLRAKLVADMFHHK